MPAGLTWSEVRDSSFTVCRNEVCFDGSFSSLHEEAPISGGPRSRVSFAAGSAAVSFSFTRSDDSFAFTATYSEPEFLSGDHFEFGIETPTGFVSVSEIVNDFQVVVPSDAACETCLAARLGGGG